MVIDTNLKITNAPQTSGAFLYMEKSSSLFNMKLCSENWIYEAHPGFSQIHAGHNQRFVTLLNAQKDEFVKVDTNPKGGWLETEASIIQTSIGLSNPSLSTPELNEMVWLDECICREGQRTMTMHTQNLGQNAMSIAGSMSVNEVAALCMRVVNASEVLFLQTGYWNLYLNASNIIDDVKNRYPIIIDWFKHKQTKRGGVKVLATGIRRFIQPYTKSHGLSVAILSQQVQSDLQQRVIDELVLRKNIF